MFASSSLATTHAFVALHGRALARRHALSSRRSATSTIATKTPGSIPTKYIVVTGGVISGIGKGVTASSIGVCMKMLGAKVTAVKIDPYLNVDAGTMSPMEHGECFVLDDGGETDLDLGNYERFLDVMLGSDSNLTTGKIYKKVIEKERRGEYLGKTVQIIPHITNEIIERVESVAARSVDGSGERPDVCIIELGGTVGDIESMPFVEAMRQLQLKVGNSNFCLVHVSMVPTVGPEPGEQKTKPTQHSVKELRSLGLSPNFIVCRSKTEVAVETREKIGSFCNVPTERVLSLYDVPNIYCVPSEMLARNMDILICEQLNLRAYRKLEAATTNSNVDADGDRRGTLRLQRDTLFKEKWIDMVHRMDVAKDEVRIAMVGKYTAQGDSYLSVQSSLSHACVAINRKLKLLSIDSELIEQNDPDALALLHSAAGILVPGGFGNRGTAGKLAAIKYARETKVPFLGICLGMQLSVIEFSRNVLGVKKATSSEFDQAVVGTPEEAVLFMPEGSKEEMGGTMRLGSRRTYLREGSLAHRLYGALEIDERHRHRYEVNPKLVPALEAAGLLFTGLDDTGERAEVVELARDQRHPFFFGLQGHPEFKSRPLSPSPPFLGFVEAAAAAEAAAEAAAKTEAKTAAASPKEEAKSASDGAATK